MECFRMPVFKDYTREELKQIKIEAPEEQMRKKVQKNWDHVAKPLDGMGRFEALTAQIGAVLGTEVLDLSKKAVLIFCADNGIVEEGISQSGQEVTTAVVQAMGRNASSVGKMSAKAGAVTIPIDIGMSHKGSIPGVRNEKLRCGTRNFRREPAMTEEETVKAIATGIKLVQECKRDGYMLLATGEMGIGNTTTSAALAAILLDEKPENVTGYGAGLTNEGLKNKTETVRKACEMYSGYKDDALKLLSCIGGLDIAGLAGVFIGGAEYGIPVVIDGLISGIAALTAEYMSPGTKKYMIASHAGKEPALKKIITHLELKPVIDANLALGEGSGAVMVFPLLDMAMSVYNESNTFENIDMEAYECLH